MGEMIFSSDSSVLVVFCKRPQLGIGKQRVAAERGTETAFELSRLLLAAAIEDAASWDGPVVIAPAAPEDATWAAKLLRGANVMVQQGANLGERINQVDRNLRAAGAQRIIYIGTDAPGLTRERLQAAAMALDSRDAVVAPATDGGVVLLGSRVAWPELDQLPWETEQLCESLLQACGGTPGVAVLATGSDIDYWDDLRESLPALRKDSRITRQTLVDWATRMQSVSIVIPVYRDIDAMTQLLAQLAPLLEAKDDIIVVDGEPATDCQAACAQANVRYLTANTACRGTQLDIGARAAENDILWFLHADSIPTEGSLMAIRERIADGASGGYFLFRFLGARTWYKALLEGAINWRSRAGTPYGDQGLFVSREEYASAGGFSHEPLFEEVALVRNLRMSGNFDPVAIDIGVSPRRWERDGWVRRTLHNRMLAIGHKLGIQASTLARRY